MASVDFRVPQRGVARLEVFDLAGRRVRFLVDAVVEPGWSRVRWNGRDDGGVPVRGGVYVLRLTQGGRAESARIVLMR